MIKKELGVYLRVPGSSDQKTDFGRFGYHPNRTPVDSPSSGRFFLKWTFLSYTGRSVEPEWTIMGRSGRLFD